MQDGIPTRAEKAQGAIPQDAVKPDVPRGEQKKPAPGAADYLAGETKSFVRDLKPYLPTEMIGGTIPHIPGTETEAVWNAASQACGTERVHFTYAVEGGRVFYLACSSSSLGSNPDTWCPLAAALPGNSEYWDKETVYLYEQEGQASALRWDPETGRMQVFLGAARTILPRVQSMDANFVTINPEVADIVPWSSLTLNREKLTRGVARMMVLIGVLVNLALMGILFLNFVATNLVDRELDKVQSQTEQASQKLMVEAYNAMQSDTLAHMVRIQEILDKLTEVDGTLVKYEVEKGEIVWEALIPPAFAQDFGTPQGLEEDGRVRVRNTR